MLRSVSRERVRFFGGRVPGLSHDRIRIARCGGSGARTDSALVQDTPIETALRSRLCLFRKGARRVESRLEASGRTSRAASELSSRNGAQGGSAGKLRALSESRV